LAPRCSVQASENCRVQGKGGGHIAILQLIGELADLINQGWQLPFTSYRVVRGREVEQLLDRMRITVPSSIRESEKTVAERDRILAEAKSAADRIVEEAHLRALEILNERALLERARQESQRIVDQGKADAQYRVDEADRYTIGALHGLREELRALIHQVDSGLAMMEGQIDPGATRADNTAQQPANRRSRGDTSHFGTREADEETYPYSSQESA
jgi:hypothetical protein